MQNGRGAPDAFLHSAFCILHSAFLRRSGRTTYAVLAFLFLFCILIVGVSEFYLLPAMSAMKGATPAEKLRLIAYSRLLLAIVLLILFSGLVLTVRVGRFFIPRPWRPRSKTRYVDVWAEAGRRAAEPTDERSEEDEDDADEPEEDEDD